MTEYAVEVKVADPAMWDKVITELNYVFGCTAGGEKDLLVLTAKIRYDPNHPFDVALPNALNRSIQGLLRDGMISWSKPKG